MDLVLAGRVSIVFRPYPKEFRRLGARRALGDEKWALHALDVGRLRQLVEAHMLNSGSLRAESYDALVGAAGGYARQPHRPYGFRRWRRYHPLQRFPRRTGMPGRRRSGYSWYAPG